MILVDNYDSYKYTKIQIPIELKQLIVEDEQSEIFIDVRLDDYYQADFVLKGQKFKEMHIEKIKNVNLNDSDTNARWQLNVIVFGGKTEEQSFKIIDDLCEIFNLNFALSSFNFVYSGFCGFSYNSLALKRYYANEDMEFGDMDIVRHATMNRKSLYSIECDIFSITCNKTNRSKLFNNLSSAYINSLKCKDLISRFITMYYLFEIIYSTKEYKKIEKCKSNTENRKKRCANLLLYLNNFGIFSYKKDDINYELDASILEIIINTRNNLTHRIDTSNITEVLYNYMIPIVKEILLVC